MLTCPEKYIESATDTPSHRSGELAEYREHFQTTLRYIHMESTLSMHRGVLSRDSTRLCFEVCRFTLLIPFFSHSRGGL